MEKKLVALLLVVLLAVCGLAPAALAAENATVRLPAGYTGLNVRSGPGTGYRVVAWVLNGDAIQVLSEGASWSKIKVVKNARKGYIKNVFILKDGEEPEVPEEPEIGARHEVGRVAAKYASSTVNLRKGPGTNYASIGSLRNGSRLDLHALKGNWYYVKTPTGLRGYISRAYVALGYPTTTTAKVNLRKTAGGAVLSTLNRGTAVTVVYAKGEWSKVKCARGTGYVYSKYLK